MLDAIRAEALKLRRHRATWLMVWIYPIGITLLAAGVLLYGLATGPHAAKVPGEAARWIHDTTVLWNVPRSGPGRFLIAGFAAVAFAGEYGWNTWKLIIPARARWQLIAAKWAVTLAFMLIAMIAASLIGLAADWLQSFQGQPIPAGVTLGAILEAHAQAAGYTLLSMAFTIAFAGMFAILTQSILATVILSIAIVVLEGLLPLLGVLAYAHAPALTKAALEFLPLYPMANLAHLASGGEGLVLPLGPGATLSMPWGTSLAMVLGWTLAAAAVTQARFLRQDLN